MLEKDASNSIHHRNLQVFATEIYKVRKGLSPAIKTELFEHKEENYYNLRNNAEFAISAIRTVYHGSESISYLGPKIWNILPDRLKNANSLETFKSEIKKWKPENCPCRLCKSYLQNIGFIGNTKTFFM